MFAKYLLRAMECTSLHCAIVWWLAGLIDNEVTGSNADICLKVFSVRAPGGQLSCRLSTLIKVSLNVRRPRRGLATYQLGTFSTSGPAGGKNLARFSELCNYGIFATIKDKLHYSFTLWMIQLKRALNPFIYM